tara:strand:- start:57 stop:542 length:486 start_codon:yes stop_codon:yes gene_type:complete
MSTISCEFYTSGVPISKSNHSQIDSNVLGAWANFNEEGKLEMAIKVSALDEHNYIFSAVDFTKDGERLNQLDNHVAHSTTINGQDYINIRPLDKKGRVLYYFFKYEIKGDTLFGYTINREQFKDKFSSSKKFKKYIKKNSKEFDKKFELIYRLVKINPSFK